MSINSIISLKRLFPSNTSLRLALYDYLSENYSISDKLFERFKYFWNYDLLLKNKRISPVLRDVIEGFIDLPEQRNIYRKGGIYEEVKEAIITGKTTVIDIIWSTYKIIEEDNWGDLMNTLYPLKVYKRDDARIEVPENIYLDIIKILLENNTIEVPHCEILSCFKQFPESQRWLPVHIEWLKEHEDIIHWSYLSSNESIIWTKDIIRDFKDNIDWHNLTSNSSVDWSTELLLAFKDKLNWDWISSEISLDEEQIQIFEEKLDWHYIAMNPKIKWSVKLLDKYKSNFSGNDFERILMNLQDTEDFECLFQICKKSCKFSFDLIKRYNNRMTEIVFDDISAYRDFLTNEFLCISPIKPLNEAQISLINKQNQISWGKCNITEESKNYWNNDKLDLSEFLGLSIVHKSYFLGWGDKKKLSHLNWNWLSFNSNIHYTRRLILAFKDFWNWDLLSINPNIPFDIAFLNEFKYKINWHLLSGLESNFWNEDILAQFSDKLIWGMADSTNFEYSNIIDYSNSISSNTSIPWSIELLERFKDYLDWFQISRNPAIPWSEKLIYTFRGYLPVSKDALLSNENFYISIVAPKLNSTILSNLLKEDKFPFQVFPERCIDYKEHDYYYYHLTDELNFGKYKGKTLLHILQTDLNYVLWALKNVYSFYVWYDVIDYLDKKFYLLDVTESEIRHYDISKSHLSSFKHSFRDVKWRIKLEDEIQREIFGGSGDDWDDWADESSSSLLDDAFEGDPDNYWNID